MPRIRLLLVDDDQDNLDGLSILLGSRYAVFAHASAVNALQAIEVARPNVVLLDIGMHPVDGVQCLAAIRATPGYRDVPAVALTGFARDVDRRCFLDGGFQAVVVKPIVDFDRLTALIERLARRHALPLPRATVAGLDDKDVISPSGTDESRETDERGGA